MPILSNILLWAQESRSWKNIREVQDCMGWGEQGFFRLAVLLRKGEGEHPHQAALVSSGPCPPTHILLTSFITSDAQEADSSKVSCDKKKKKKNRAEGVMEMLPH